MNFLRRRVKHQHQMFWHEEPPTSPGEAGSVFSRCDGEGMAVYNQNALVDGCGIVVHRLYVRSSEELNDSLRRWFAAGSILKENGPGTMTADAYFTAPTSVSWDAR